MDIYEAISAAGADDIADILDHVLFRYTELFPQWSVSVLSVDKRVDAIAQLDEEIAFLERLKKEPSLLQPCLIRK